MVKKTISIGRIKMEKIEVTNLDLATSYLGDAVRQHIDFLKTTKDIGNHYTAQYLERAYKNFRTHLDAKKEGK